MFFICVVCILMCSCDYFLKNPGQISRLEKDLVDEGEVVIEAIENEPPQPGEGTK